MMLPLFILVCLSVCLYQNISETAGPAEPNLWRLPIYRKNIVFTHFRGEYNISVCWKESINGKAGWIGSYSLNICYGVVLSFIYDSLSPLNLKLVKVDLFLCFIMEKI